MQIDNKILKIKGLLKQKNITQQQFAELINVSVPTVRNWFNGRSKIDIDTLEKIAIALGVSPCYFFDCGESKHIINHNGIQAVNGGQVQIQLAQAEKEIERLKAEVEGYKKLIEEKERHIQLQNNVIEMLKNKQ